MFLLLLLGMLPDFDLVLGIFGVQHRTLMHSVIFWSVLFAPFFAKYRLAALPYFVAVTQHILLGDLIVGRTPVLWPLEIKLGLGLSIISPVNLSMEAMGLALFGVLAFRENRLSLQNGGGIMTAAMAVLAIIALLGFALLASLGDYLLPIVLEESDARYLEKSLPTLLAGSGLQIAVVMHAMLAGMILILFVRAPRKHIEASRH